MSHQREKRRRSVASGETVMAFIPARAGSKGIVGKNCRLLAGKPLVAYSILAAVTSRLIERVVVSTDCPEIARVSREWGAEVPFMRPNHLATDSAPTSSALDYTLQRLEAGGYVPDVVVELYPTSPFRPAGMLDKLIRYGRRACCVQTVKPITRENGQFFQHEGGAFSYVGEDRVGSHRFLRSTGLGTVHSSKERLFPWYFYMVNDQICNVDIDEPRDWALAEEILGRKLFRFGWA